MPVTLPTNKDVHRGRKQFDTAVSNVAEQMRRPLLVAIGASDLATKALTEAVRNARSEAAERREAAQDRFTQLQERLSGIPSELTELRGRLEPTELRKLTDAYANAAMELYRSLAERGDTALERLRSRPEIKRALDRFEDVTETVEDRIEEMVNESRDAAQNVLTRISRQTRSVGERTARATQRVAASTAEQIEEGAEELAEAVTEAGEHAAHSTRSTTRKAANRTRPATAARKAPAHKSEAHD
jgi:heparin binding hemagglutinin HbhA